jgi:hypothetical protein
VDDRFRVVVDDDVSTASSESPMYSARSRDQTRSLSILIGPERERVPFSGHDWYGFIFTAEDAEKYGVSP